MIMRNLISVIVPMYNAEDYVTSALMSVIEQVDVKTEIIVIDDGSSDESVHLVELLKVKNDAIRLFRVDHEGVSNARNMGIEYANGEFIMFLDPDDSYEKDYCNHMLKSITEMNADMVMANFFVRKNQNLKYKNKISPLSTQGILNSDDAISDVISDHGFKGFVWNKIYRTDLLKNIRFDVNLSYLEDLLFNIKAIKRSNLIGYTVFTGYNYLQRFDSASHQFNTSYYQTLSLIQEEVNAKQKNLLKSIEIYSLFSDFNSTKSRRKSILNRIKLDYSKINYKDLSLDSKIKTGALKIGFFSPKFGIFISYLIGQIQKSALYSIIVKIARP